VFNIAYRDKKVGGVSLCVFRASLPEVAFRYSNISSNINIFRGNPDLDPSLTDKFDLGYINRWDKSNNTSMYFENTVDVFSLLYDMKVVSL
jgi:outer membrane receptor protein involved in Fe transport